MSATQNLTPGQPVQLPNGQHMMVLPRQALDQLLVDPTTIGPEYHLVESYLGYRMLAVIVGRRYHRQWGADVYALDMYEIGTTAVALPNEGAAVVAEVGPQRRYGKRAIARVNV